MQPPGAEAEGADVDFSEVYSMGQIAYNAKILNYCRTFVAIVSGIAAGIMGLEGLAGFFAFLVTMALLSVGLYLKVSMKPDPFFKKPNDIWFEGISGAPPAALRAPLPFGR